MGFRIARLIGLTMMGSLAFVPAAHAGPHFSIHIGVGAPVAVAPVVRPGYIWRPGYYVRTDFGYQWVPGAWVPAPYDRVVRRDGDRDEVYARRGWDGDRYENRDHDRDRDWDRDRDRDRARDWNRERDWNRDRDWRR